MTIPDGPLDEVAALLGYSTVPFAPARLHQIMTDTAVASARVAVLARDLPFDAEPWGFGQELLRLMRPR
jgi:hypothetical protein